jgi:hypothetical protein
MGTLKTGRATSKVADHLVQTKIPEEQGSHDDQWDDVFEEGDEVDEQMITSEGMPLKTAEVMKELGIDREHKLNELREQGIILGVWWKDEYYYPAWQFIGNGKILPGLQAVISTLNTHSPWEKLDFMLSENVRLKDQNTPLNELRQGNIESVVLAATS